MLILSIWVQCSVFLWVQCCVFYQRPYFFGQKTLCFLLGPITMIYIVQGLIGWTEGGEINTEVKILVIKSELQVDHYVVLWNLGILFHKIFTPSNLEWTVLLDAITSSSRRCWTSFVYSVQQRTHAKCRTKIRTTSIFLHPRHPNSKVIPLKWKTIQQRRTARRNNLRSKKHRESPLQDCPA